MTALAEPQPAVDLQSTKTAEPVRLTVAIVASMVALIMSGASLGC